MLNHGQLSFILRRLTAAVVVLLVIALARFVRLGARPLSLARIATRFVTLTVSLVRLTGLSFCGLAAGPSTPYSGRMPAENRTFLFDAPIAAMVPRR